MAEGSLARAYVEELAWLVAWLLQSSQHPGTSIDEVVPRLGQYGVVAELWDSPDLKQAISDLCDWRCELSQSSSGVYYNEPFCAFPAEILLVVKVRALQGQPLLLPPNDLLPDFLQNIPATSEQKDVRLTQLLEILPKVN